MKIVYMENMDPKAFLLFAIRHFDLKISSEEGNRVFLNPDYCIEVESNGLFKLLQNQQVVAPFADVEELCLFIKKDIELNE